MNFYRIKKGTRLYSFDDPIGQVPVLDKSLNETQTTFIKAVDGVLVDVESEQEIKDDQAHFVFDENIYFTLPFLHSCLNEAKTAESNLQFCLTKNSFNNRFVLPTALDVDACHVLNFTYKINSSNVVQKVVNQKIIENSIKIPNQIVSGAVYSMDQCAVFAAHIISPFHLLQVNIALNLNRTINLQTRIPDFLINIFGKTHGKWYYRALKSINKIGKNCGIHPTAIIEGSIIGNNVTIGANSIVRLSVVESGCHVSENVTVTNTVLGKDTFIANSNYISSCVTYSSVFLISGPYTFSIFGESSSCFAVINCDYRLDQQNIKIPTSDGLLDSGQPLLGIAHGHRSKTGGGNIIAAGRIVPNDLHIKPPDNIILSFEKK